MHIERGVLHDFRGGAPKNTNQMPPPNRNYIKPALLKVNRLTHQPTNQPTQPNSKTTAQGALEKCFLSTFATQLCCVDVYRGLEFISGFTSCRNSSRWPCFLGRKRSEANHRGSFVVLLTLHETNIAVENPP